MSDNQAINTSVQSYWPDSATFLGCLKEDCAIITKLYMEEPIKGAELPLCSRCEQK